MLNDAGPLILDHAYFTIDPSGSLEAEPLRVVLFAGSVMLMSAPAFETGPRLAASTVTVTSSEPVAPLSSVTCKLKTYTPAAKPVAVVDALPALVILYWEGP